MPIIKENLNQKNCIRTISGIYFNVKKPTVDMVNITDIAHALSHESRWGGHTKELLSVAQHSVHCAMLARDYHKLDRRTTLTVLLHDASEAYLKDLPRPIKDLLPDYKIMEEKIQKVIAEKFDLEYPFPPIVHEIDDYMLSHEWSNLVTHDHVVPEFVCFSPNRSKQMFLREYKNLTT